MRVVVNCSFVVPGVVGGTEEFSVRLLRSVLAHQSDVEVGIVAQRRFFEVYPDLAFRAVGSLRGPASNRAYRVAAESLWLPTRTKLRIDSALPRCTKSSTARLDPSRVIP